MKRKSAPALKHTLISATAILVYVALGTALVTAIDRVVADGTPIWQGLVRFFSYFTVLTNALGAVILTAFLAKPEGDALLTRPSMVSAVAVYFTSLALLYTFALRNFWNPQGFTEILVDILLHDAVPALFVLCWLLLVPKGTLRVTDAAIWLIFPLGYWVCVFVGGAVLNVYPYPLTDASILGWPRALTNAAIQLGTVLVLGLVAVAIDRWMAKPNAGHLNDRGRRQA
jgi:hypothetical protein